MKVAEVGRQTDHFLHLQWDDGHAGYIPITDVGAYGNGKTVQPSTLYYDLSVRSNSSQVFWDSPTSEIVKRWEWGTMVGNDEMIREFIAHYMKYGIAFIENTPHELGDVEVVLKEMDVFPVWDNLFGRISSVKYQKDPTNQAFNSQYLELHTDLPYYTQTPSVYLFHCITNDFEGGESFWGDTFSAADHMRRQEPEMFKILRKVLVPFRQYRSGWYLAGKYPTFEYLGKDLYRVRVCGFVADNYRFSQDYDVGTRTAWWMAYQYLRKLMDDTNRHVKTKLEPGQLVFIDNWRVQHGREEFKVTTESASKSRIMQAVYVEWTHLQNRLLKI